jgi:heme/copper-type cytochrome/quinol oxidase subunit 1
VLLASPPIDFQLHDTYFVVAHMHYVLFGGSVFGVFAAIYLWFPKMTGRLLSEGLGKLHFATVFVGFHLTFLVQHLLGMQGMPRRIADYREADGFTGLNVLSSTGAFLTGISTLFLLWNIVRSLRKGEPAGDDPGGATPSSGPPPRLRHRRTSTAPSRRSGRTGRSSTSATGCSRRTGRRRRRPGTSRWCGEPPAPAGSQPSVTQGRGAPLGSTGRRW